MERSGARRAWLAALVVWSVLGDVTGSAALKAGRTYGKYNKLPSMFGVRDKVYDPCYSDYKQPIKCVPTFQDAGSGRPAKASSTCGQPPATFCSYDRRHDCQMCDAAKTHLAHPASYATDFHNIHNKTCWWSPPVALANADNVSLTVSLGKRFDVVYVNIEFCQSRPDSMALLKSADFGQTWQPYQYYSSDCGGVYGLKAKMDVAVENEQEALCINPEKTTDGGFIADGRIVFSTLEKRPSSRQFDTSPVLHDWVTLTDIRVVFTRPVAPLTNRIDVEAQRDATYFYGVANVVVGGRCKCNGHASRCVQHKADSRLVCDCRHNTAGDDCERCKPFHFDRPWARAVADKANECIACNCNLHAKKCRFDKDLYLQSGRRSGGVCMNCRHNTAGRYCHYCKDGYYRDYTKPIIHRKACKACRCHPIGSVGKLCNQTTGQCPCKEGVTGVTCNRCAKGFQQSRSPNQPCMKLPPNAPVPDEVSKAPSTSCAKQKCRANSRKVTLSKFCRRDYAVQVEIVAKDESDADWIKFTVTIQAIFKRSKLLKMPRGNSVVWMSKQDNNCGCPRLKVGQRYLLLGEDAKRDGLTVTRESVAIQWHDEWLRRVRLLKRAELKGECYGTQ